MLQLVCLFLYNIQTKTICTEIFKGNREVKYLLKEKQIQRQAKIKHKHKQKRKIEKLYNHRSRESSKIDIKLKSHIFLL